MRIGRDLLDAAKALAPAIVADRRAIHQWPELAYQEHKTSALVASRLHELSLDQVQTGIATTGVIGLIRGDRPGKTVLLRADMDALPVTEASEQPYASQNAGVMHACGHDGHTAMLLGATRLLMQRRDSFAGNVKLMFQPAEEGGAGALRMIEQGLLEDPRVDAAFALHVIHFNRTGEIGVAPGPVLAASDRFTVTVTGRGGHASRPEIAVDPVVVAAHVLTALQTLVSREVAAAEQAVVTVGSIQAGNAANDIPDFAVMRGTVRTYAPEVQSRIQRRIAELAEGIAVAMRASAQVEYVVGYPPLVNHESGVETVREAVAALGLTPVVDQPQMGGEDFSYVLQRVPGAFMRLGVRNPEWQEERPIHSSSFDLDEEALPIGAAMMAATALRYLEG